LVVCFALAGVLLGLEVVLPADPAVHITLQSVIIVTVYSLIALLCYLDERSQPVREEKRSQQDGE
jgi:hypothetical protein